MTKKIIIPAIIFFIAAILIYCMGGSAVAYAAESSLEFDKTYVLDDLEGSAVDGVTFDVNDYPYDKNGSVELLGFSEYGYSAYANMQDNFGLYIYLYNPALLDISDSSCKIQIGVGMSNAADYNKYYLKVVSKSTGTETNRFIKMKVLNADQLLSSLDSAERRYYVSGIEILCYGSAGIVEYNVGKQFNFSGFSKGYGLDSSAESTLIQSSSDLESIEITGLLDRQTVYRDNITNPSVTSHNQVNGVYFGLDQDLIDRYGLLQRIKAEWYEYRTSPILVVDNQEVYNSLYNYRGVNVGEYNNNIPYGVSTGNYVETFPILYGGITYDKTRYIYDLSYNIRLGEYTFVREYNSNSVLNKLPWVIYGENIVNNYRVSEESLKAYKTDYENMYPSTLVTDGTVRYSSDLFNTDVGAGRTAGYNVYDFDANADAFDFTDYGIDTSTYSGWQKFKAFFGWTPETESVLQNKSPIEIIDNEKFRQLSVLSDADFAREMLIDEYEVDKFKSYCSTEIAAGRVVVHFRFACTEYYTKFANITTDDNTTRRSVDNTSAFFAEENVFLNFDVLSLTFRNDNGAYRIIPVVNDPIDIISGIVGPVAPPTMGEEVGDWWQELMEKIKDFFKNGWEDIGKIIGIVVAVVVVVFVIWLVIKLFGAIGGGSKSTTVVKIDPSIYRNKKGK